MDAGWTPEWALGGHCLGLWVPGDRSVWPMWCVCYGVGVGVTDEHTPRPHQAELLPEGRKNSKLLKLI